MAKIRIFMKRNKWILFFVFTVLILFLHSPNVFLHKSLWAEDGNIFFNQAEIYGIRSLFISYSGYYHTTIRLIALLASCFSLYVIPYIYLVFVIILEFISVLLTYKVFNLEKFKYGYIIAFIPLLIPVPVEIYDNLTNSQWILAYIFAILVSLDFSKFNKFGYSLLILLLSLSGPFSIFLLPFIVLKLCLKKDFKANFSVYCAYIIGLVCQSYSVINSSRVEGDGIFTTDIILKYLNCFIFHFSSFKFLSVVIFLIALFCIYQLMKKVRDNLPLLSVFTLGFFTLCASIYSAIKENFITVGLLPDRYIYLYILSIFLIIIFTLKNKYVTILLFLVALSQFSRRPLDNIYWNQYVNFSKYEEIVPVFLPPSIGWYAEIRNQNPQKLEPDGEIKHLAYFNPNNMCKTDYIVFSSMYAKSYSPVIVSKDLQFYQNMGLIKLNNSGYKFVYILPVKNVEYKLITPDVKIHYYCMN